MDRNENFAPLRFGNALFVFALLTFVFHFTWEIIQAPFFGHLPSMNHWQTTLICLKATIGDVGIAFAGFALSATWDRDRRWFDAPSAGAVIAYFATGVITTFAFEWYSVHWANRWEYSEIMPVIPIVRVGLVPVMQWMIVPAIVLFFLQRHRGRGGCQEN